jgi:hypothetical protein
LLRTGQDSVKGNQMIARARRMEDGRWRMEDGDI